MEIHWKAARISVPRATQPARLKLNTHTKQMKCYICVFTCAVCVSICQNSNATPFLLLQSKRSSEAARRASENKGGGGNGISRKCIYNFSHPFMMGSAWRTFTLTGSLRSWQRAYKHWLLRPSGPFSDWQRVFFKEEREMRDNMDKWHVWKCPMRLKQI